MKILFYSTKDFEQPYLEAANIRKEEATFIKEALSLQTANKAKGFDVISIFSGDDASSNVLEELYKNGVKFIAIRAAGYDNVDLKESKRTQHRYCKRTCIFSLCHCRTCGGADISIKQKNRDS